MNDSFEQLFASAPVRQLLDQMYGSEEREQQIDRYRGCMEGYGAQYGNTASLNYFSAPGRTEIGGNHTDHNHGKVLAASIQLDTIAAAAAVDTGVISVISEGYPGLSVIPLDDLEPQSGEGGTAALIRGIAHGFRQHGYRIGGFQAYVSSNVLPASGLSSSASFEILICQILSTLYNDGAMDAVMMSRIGKHAENLYWNKPSGMLDQMACSHGGLITIDFKEPAKPLIERIPGTFEEAGYSLVIVGTGGNHADLTKDYASIPNEMRAVAQAFGVEVCRDLTAEMIYGRLAELRETAGDRAVLRALHFLDENDRVGRQVEAVKAGEWKDVLKHITASGNSSWKWLQNIHQESVSHEQGIALTLAITERFIERLGDGACRVHGGGFAGVILAVLPHAAVAEYRELIARTTGTELFKIRVREVGAVCLNSSSY
ncbi:galactokinase [Paenibacillus sacheonensis]|uniref:Galactokinase n=1 Tax=Paenibacillus sacheonensis TaxID=742054 RepID=A0A7X4YXS5_9BACL|nr:galactokinase family protein [Paenibacillus sacheonensis]MBM7569452.1 galactokinase [Paenibacillus sacheonensis]NBC73379.1 galactokinase [Paenibacillus sacheonensis]